MKVIPRPKANDTRSHAVLREEIQVLERLMVHGGHPNVIALKEVLEAEDTIYLVLELASGGQLMDAIASQQSFDEHDARGYMRQIVAAVQFMHQHRIVHRDMKPGASAHARAGRRGPPLMRSPHPPPPPILFYFLPPLPQKMSSSRRTPVSSSWTLALPPACPTGRTASPPRPRNASASAWGGRRSAATTRTPAPRLPCAPGELHRERRRRWRSVWPASAASAAALAASPATMTAPPSRGPPILGPRRGMGHAGWAGMVAPSPQEPQRPQSRRHCLMTSASSAFLRPSVPAPRAEGRRSYGSFSSSPPFPCAVAQPVGGNAVRGGARDMGPGAVHAGGRRVGRRHHPVHASRWQSAVLRLWGRRHAGSPRAGGATAPMGRPTPSPPYLRLTHTRPCGFA